MHVRGRLLTTVPAALGSGTTAVSLAPPAQAAPTPHDGPIIFMQVTNCDSVI